MSNTVTAKQISDLISKSEIKVMTVFDKVTIVSLRLPNDFVITESSACVDPANYDENIGRDICLERITNKLWELEGYLLANRLADGDHKEVVERFTAALETQISVEDDPTGQAYVEKMRNKGVFSDEDIAENIGYFKGLRVAREILEQCKCDVYGTEQEEDE